MNGPVAVLYFYRTKWGAHDEFVGLFRKNHWPILREELAAGRYIDVQMATPRFHGDGRADWDVLVSITYRDWAAIAEHTDAEIARRLFPDQDRYRAEEQHRFELLEAHWDVPLEPRPLDRRQELIARPMDDHLSTTQVGWLLGRSSGSVREMIRDGEIEATRIVGGFRIPRDEVLRVSRETIQEKAGRKLSDAELERLVEDVLAANEAKANEPIRLVKPPRTAEAGEAALTSDS